jgi:hypothetical protein
VEKIGVSVTCSRRDCRLPVKSDNSLDRFGVDHAVTAPSAGPKKAVRRLGPVQELMEVLDRA